MITHHTVAIVRDPADEIATSQPARWAAEELLKALRGRGVPVTHAERIDALQRGAIRVVLASLGNARARAILDQAGLETPGTAESLAIVPAEHDGAAMLLAAGNDARGLVYATLELTDRVRTADADPVGALFPAQPIVQQPANPIRGIARLFTSDIEDLSWYRDQDFWQRYLSVLIAHRFNRIHLAFGIGHDFLRNVVDAYLLFAYPFLVDVQGYGVRVPGFSDTERQLNLEALRFASDEAATRGLHFQLGIWTQAYQWVDSPNANYIVEGLTAENHAAYCRDAITAILQACPSIGGVTFRVHGESGVPEGNYDFWREVFRGVVACGRTVELDLHPKGVGREMIDVALETGLPVRLSPKYTAEHMGLPAQQVSIRELERNPRVRGQDAFVEHLMNQSAGVLNFTRYGSGDFLKEDRQYGVFYRIWPGTQRLLLWGDPVLAAGFGRHGSFCGAQGVEICEPLSFKGRRGSGQPGGRTAYADQELATDGSDFDKYQYTYRLFGRLLYDPEEHPSVWRRALVHDFGPAAEPLEVALANASRILPLITSAHLPSAANNRFWPEIYTNMPLLDGDNHPYRDTVVPRRFGSVSPLDPGLFSSIEDFVREVHTRQPSGRISPLRVAATLDELAATAVRQLEQAKQLVDNVSRAEFRRVAIDVAIQAGLGRFFAAKLRAGVAYTLYCELNEPSRLARALQDYRDARAAWLEVAELGRIYRSDITVGGEPWLRGHWSDRQAAIDEDMAALEALHGRTHTPDGHAAPVLDDLEPPRLQVDCLHQPAVAFTPGQPLPIELDLQSAAGEPLDAELHYRHVNQAETYSTLPLQAIGDRRLRAEIPGEYTASKYPLQYYFVLRQGRSAARYPDLEMDLANQPYFVVRQQSPPFGARSAVLP